MNRWLIRSVQIAALAMGGLALTGTAAHADFTSGPNVGFGNGNQSSFVYQAPTNICGNSLAIIGFASANCDGGGAYAVSGNGGNYSGAGYNHSNGGGNANANGVNHKKHKKHKKNNDYANNNSFGSNNDYDDNGHNGGGGAFASNNNGDWTTGYNVGFGNGNQSSFVYQAPTNISCNSVALIGFAQSC